MTALSKDRENRIVRGIGLIFLLQDITQLDKHGYSFLSQCCGFMAHHSRQGFIEHYGDEDNLKRDIILHSSNNQWENFRKGEKDYEYMMQRKRIYNKVVKISRGFLDLIPADEDCYKPKAIWSLVKANNSSREYIENAFRSHLTNGNYFNLKDINIRVKDLSDATEAYSEAISAGMKDDEFLNEEFLFSIGQTGSVSSLLDIYREEVWEMFNSLSGRGFHLGL